MLDLYTHILHGLDDGPRSLEDSLELARAAVADGVRLVAATPHVREVTALVGHEARRKASARHDRLVRAVFREPGRTGGDSGRVTSYLSGRCSATAESSDDSVPLDAPRAPLYFRRCPVPVAKESSLASI